MDKLDFLDAPEGADTPVVAPTTDAPAPAPEASTAAPEQANDGRARGADGKFVSKPTDAAPVVAEAAPQAPAIAPAAVTPQAEPARAPDGFVPVSVVQAMREELNAFKRQQQQQPPQPAPDPFEDFEGYQRHQEAQTTLERADWSRQLAEHKHGGELVEKAQQWAAERAETDPQFRERSWTARDPYGFAIAEFQRDQALQMLSDPKLLEQFRAFQSGQAPAPQAAAFTPPSPQPVAPPPSITSAPSAGGVPHVPTGPGQAYGEIFG